MINGTTMQVEKMVLHNITVKNLMGQLSRSEKGEERKHPVPPTTAEINKGSRRTADSKHTPHRKPVIKSKRKLIYTSVQMEDDGFLLSIVSVNLILFCVGLLQQTPPLMLTLEYFLSQSSLNLSPKALQLRWFCQTSKLKRSQSESPRTAEGKRKAGLQT